MPDEQNSEHELPQQEVFQIRIRGHLDAQWTDWFDGLDITLEADGNTLLSGPVVDQSALHGILKKIRDLGIPLLSVISLTAKADMDEMQGDKNDQSISEL